MRLTLICYIYVLHLDCHHDFEYCYCILDIPCLKLKPSNYYFYNMHINLIILFVCFHFNNLDENRFQNLNIYMLIINDIVLNMLIVLVFKVNVPCLHVCVCIIVFIC